MLDNILREPCFGIRVYCPKMQDVTAFVERTQEYVEAVIDRGRKYACWNVSEPRAGARGIEDIFFWKGYSKRVRSDSAHILECLAVKFR